MLRRRLLVAVLLLLVPGAFAFGAHGVAAKPGKKSPRLHAFRSCSNLRDYAQRHGVRVIRDSFVFQRGGAPPPAALRDGGAGGGAGGRGEAVPVAGGDDSGSGGTTSPTNVQEEGVDEPDRVKAADGRLYVATGSKLRIVDATASPPRLLGTLDLPGYSGDMLLRGSTLLVIAQLGFGGGDGPVATAAQRITVPPAEWLSRTRLLEVDVADPAAPRVVRSLDVEGGYVNGRLTGDTARVVVATEPRGLTMPDEAGSTIREVRRNWRRSVRRTRTAAWLPGAVLRERRTGKRQRRALVRCRQVRRTQAFAGLGTLTVLTIDMSGNRPALPAVDVDSLMTSGETVYASQDRLYIASERWLGDDPTRREVLDDAATGLHAFDTTKPFETTYAGSGEVPGYLLNQWSLSEHAGVLRAATTSMPPWDSERESESAVRTLEEREGQLVEIGRAGGLGRGERIYAVRFMGDKGFVVTFRETDPLYTLDLSDPRAPRVIGELKVPGYSAYLHPVGPGLLLGVGQDATEEGMTTGVQVSLFDVADLRAPKRIAQLGVGKESYSEVENDHHAFLWWEPERLAIVPVFQYTADYDGIAFAGAVLYRVDAFGGLQELSRVGNPTREPSPFDRSVVVGDRLLLLWNDGVVSTPLAAPGHGDVLRFGG